jgi:hypothetical protein
VHRVRGLVRTGFRGARWRPLAVAAAAWFSLGGAVAATAGEAGDFAIVDICSDDTGEDAAAFLRNTLHVFAESKLRVRFRCADPLATGEHVTTASFVVDEAGIALQLVSPTDQRSVRNIPWLEDGHRPLAQTLALGRGTALGLILEALTADLGAVQLRPLPAPRAAARAPAPPPPSSAVEPRGSSRAAEPSASSGAGHPVAARNSSSPTPVVDGRGRMTSPTTSPALEIALPLVGIVWMPPDTVAPQFEVGLGVGGPRWWAVLDLVLALDSNFAIEGRTFQTAGYGLRLGIRRTLARVARFRWDADLTAVGHLSQYRRDDIPGTETHQWLDVGAAVHSRAVFHLARHLVALVSLGADVCPTARLASIPGSPGRRVNLATLAIVAGLGVDF